jgi:DNA phosphorothioation-dependent restriction protein DptF
MGEEFPALWNAIDATRARREYVDEENDIQVINLSHRALYETHPRELGEGLLRRIVEKFAFDQPDSPFHEAYKRERQECTAGEQCPLHYNASQFTNEVVRDRVASVLAGNGLISTAYLNPRSVLDHISSMILPQSLQRVDDGTPCPVGSAAGSAGFGPETVLWNTVFEELRGPKGGDLGHIDPAAQSSVSLDQRLLSLGADPQKLKTLTGDAPLLENAPTATRLRTILRRLYLLDEPLQGEEITTAMETAAFEEFLGSLTYLNLDAYDGTTQSELQHHIKDLLGTVRKSLQGWSGSADDDHIEFVDGIKSTDYRFLSKWSSPDPDIEESHRQTQEETTPGQLWLVLQPEGTEVTVPVPVTFELYQLMNQIRDGYNPNALDLERSEGMRLIHSRLSEFTNKQELVRVVDKLDNELFRVEDSGFGTVEIKSEGQR